MRELQKRQEIRKRLYSLPVLVLLFIATIGFGKGAYTLLLKERESAKDSGLLMAKVQSLSKREIELKNEIEKLNTEEGIEEEIKSKFNVARDGEYVAVIVDGKETVASTTPKEEPWYKRLWGAIVDQ